MSDRRKAEATAAAIGGAVAPSWLERALLAAARDSDYFLCDIVTGKRVAGPFESRAQATKAHSHFEERDYLTVEFLPRCRTCGDRGYVADGDMEVPCDECN